MSVNLIQTDTNKLQLLDGSSATGTAALNELAEFGRTAADPDITYLTLRNASGTKVYIYPAAGGTTLIITTTAP